MTFLYFAIALLLVLVALRVLPRLAFRAIMNRPAALAAMSEYDRRRAIEEATLEPADWFGNTGLDEDIERELPRYLRREFGEFMDDEGSLQAAQLVYLGAFDEPDARVHYWRVPASSQEPVFAYVEIDGDETICTGWGSRQPPGAGQAVP